MTEHTSLLTSSREIYLPMRILLNSETIIISHFSRQQVSGGTWQSMCHKAWQWKMHVGHMATRHAEENGCVTHGKPCVHMHVNKDAYKMGGQFVEEGRSRKERRRKKIRERKERNKEREGEKKRKNEKRKSAFRRSELVGLRSKVQGLHFKR